MQSTLVCEVCGIGTPLCLDNGLLGLYVRAVDGVVVCIEHFGDLFVILINIKTLGKNDFFAGERNGATGAIENVHTVQIFAVGRKIKHTG